MLRTYKTPKGTELPLLNLRGREYLEVKYRLVWFREDHPDWAIETELLSVTDQSAYGRATIKDEKGRTIATSHKFETRKGFPDFIEKAETGSIGRALALIGYGTQFCADELDEGKRIVDSPVEPNAKSAPQSERRAPAKAPTAESAAPTMGQPSRSGSATQAQTESKAKPAASHAQPSVSAVSKPPVREAQAPETNSGRAPSRFEGSKDPGEYQVTFGKKYKGLRLREIPRNELEGYLEWLEESATKKGVPLSEEARFLKVAAGRFLSATKNEVAAQH